MSTDPGQHRQPFRGLHDADVYYGWMAPEEDWALLAALRAGVRAGTIRSSARLVIPALPVSYYAATQDNARYMWLDVHKATLATRHTRLPFSEHTFMASARRKRDRKSMRLINASIYLLEYDLSSSEWDGVNLTNQLCLPKVYTKEHCPTPAQFLGAKLADK